jgi:hypothetical protein
MHIISAILLLIIEGLPSLFKGDTAWYMTVNMLNLQGIIFLFLILRPPDKKNIIARSLFLVFLIYKIVDYSLNIPHTFYDYEIYLKSYQVTAGICLIIFLYNLFKPYTYKSDTITEFHNIHLCFWRPGNVATLLPSLLGFAIGGVSIYTRGRLHGFRWTKSKYQDDEVSPKIIEKKFIVLDTGIKSNVITENIFLNLRNVRAGRLRIRCISTIKPLLEHLGSKYNPSGWLELIPAIYSARILKG